MEVQLTGLRGGKTKGDISGEQGEIHGGPALVPRRRGGGDLERPAAAEPLTPRGLGFVARVSGVFFADEASAYAVAAELSGGGGAAAAAVESDLPHSSDDARHAARSLFQSASSSSGLAAGAAPRLPLLVLQGAAKPTNEGLASVSALEHLPPLELQYSFSKGHSAADLIKVGTWDGLPRYVIDGCLRPLTHVA